jgi:hypothetical protein
LREQSAHRTAQYVKSDGDAGRRFAARRVQNVGR